jgi:ATP-binding cassette subfamily G (WHITE) protein 2
LSGSWYKSPDVPPYATNADGQIVCGSLADDDRDRPMRQGDYCECKEGWTGINCNVCTENKACNALMPTKDGGVCYQNGEVVHENYQMCDVTNKNILSLLDGRRPQVTFSCNADEATCAFQCKYDTNEMWSFLTVCSSLGRT